VEKIIAKERCRQLMEALRTQLNLRERTSSISLKRSWKVSRRSLHLHREATKKCKTTVSRFKTNFLVRRKSINGPL